MVVLSEALEAEVVETVAEAEVDPEVAERRKRRNGSPAQSSDVSFSRCSKFDAYTKACPVAFNSLISSWLIGKLCSHHREPLVCSQRIPQTLCSIARASAVALK